MRAYRDVRILEAKPHRPLRERRTDDLDEILRRDPALERGIDLLGGLLYVAEVRDERPGVRTHQREAVAAGVSGQIPNVDEVGDEHDVGAGIRQAGDQALGAGAHPASSFFRRSSASRYPSGPL